MKFAPLLVLAIALVACTVTSYDGSIKIVNESDIPLTDITYAGEAIQEGATRVLPAGSSGEIMATLPSGYRYAFPVTVKISIRENYLITIHGSGEMREGAPRLYAMVQVYDP